MHTITGQFSYHASTFGDYIAFKNTHCNFQQNFEDFVKIRSSCKLSMQLLRTGPNKTAPVSAPDLLIMKTPLRAGHPNLAQTQDSQRFYVKRRARAWLLECTTSATVCFPRRHRLQMCLELQPLGQSRGDNKEKQLQTQQLSVTRNTERETRKREAKAASTLNLTVMATCAAENPPESGVHCCKGTRFCFIHASFFTPFP